MDSRVALLRRGERAAEGPQPAPMPPVDAFRNAMETGDLDAAEGMLAEDVAFHAPAPAQPLVGRDVTAMIIRGVLAELESFRYVRQYTESGRRDSHALMFKATFDGEPLTGCDLLRFNSEGLIAEVTVMLGPLVAANALVSRLTGEAS